VEFLRFGSSIPGSYWGCCACCIIQNFTVEPDGPASIELVEGDGGTPLGRFAGKTYHEVFRQRLRYGTFSAKDMPNHAFIAILSKTQLGSAIGKKWLAILKAEGFEFLRTVNNSVWNVENYIFILVRNVGPNAVKSTSSRRRRNGQTSRLSFLSRGRLFGHVDFPADSRRGFLLR
jgi:hypothetical protein